MFEVFTFSSGSSWIRYPNSMGDLISSKSFLGKWDLHMENLGGGFRELFNNLKPNFILVKADEPVLYPT